MYILLKFSKEEGTEDSYMILRVHNTASAPRRSYFFFFHFVDTRTATALQDHLFRRAYKTDASIFSRALISLRAHAMKTHLVL